MVQDDLCVFEQKNNINRQILVGVELGCWALLWLNSSEKAKDFL